MLAIPIVRVAILDDIASMGIDMLALRVLPELSVDQFLSREAEGKDKHEGK